MKKFIIAFVATLFAFTAFAQDDTFVYAEIFGSWGQHHTEMLIHINFGDNTTLENTDTYLNGKTGVFKSMIDAMNWMSANGWDFVQAYNDYAYYEALGYNILVEHWIVRKNINCLTQEELEAVKNAFPTKSDFNQNK